MPIHGYESSILLLTFKNTRSTAHTTFGTRAFQIEHFSVIRFGTLRVHSLSLSLSDFNASPAAAHFGGKGRRRKRGVPLRPRCVPHRKADVNSALEKTRVKVLKVRRRHAVGRSFCELDEPELPRLVEEEIDAEEGELARATLAVPTQLPCRT